jgi:hypothetical protein
MTWRKKMNALVVGSGSDSSAITHKSNSNGYMYKPTVDLSKTTELVYKG